MNELPEDAIPCGKAAKLLHSDPSMVWRWVAEGKLPGWKVGRRLFVSRADVLAQVRQVVPAKGKAPRPETERQKIKRETAATLERWGLTMGPA